jgi:hypothetical protein
MRSQSSSLRKLFQDLGYSPREKFNAMNYDRMIFNDFSNNRRVDIFLNIFEMCHKFDFTHRIKVDKITLPLADLLLTKLQVYEITDREYRDVISLLLDHEISNGDEDPERINVKYVAKLCANDWGLWKTTTLNLNRIESALSSFELTEEQRELVKERIDLLKQTIASMPKSMRWSMRAKLGEKVRWYELPEEDKKVVDSKFFETPPTTKTQ